MRRPDFIVVVLVFCVWSLPAATDVEWEDVLDVTRNIVCTCGCPTTLVSACSCHRAEEMNREVETMLNEGSTHMEIYDHYIAQFGVQVLAAPRAEGFNLVGWVFPFVVLLLGGIGVLIGYRSLKGDGSLAAAGAPVSAGVDERYQKLIRRELADLDPEN